MRKLVSMLAAATLAASLATIVTSTPSTAAVPPATGNNAVITVKVGGDRTSGGGVSGLAGVTLQLFDGATAPTVPAVGVAPNTCASDAAGDCSWTIPATQVGGANRDRRFWVVQIGTGAGYFPNQTLVTGASPFVSRPYRFQTGTQLRNGVTYSSSTDFMVGTGNTTPDASGGIWQDSRNNPALPAECGLRVALILDVSGSVQPFLANLKTAATTFVNALVGTPSSLALYTFATTAPANTTNNQNRPLTPVSTQAGANTVNGYINGLTAGGNTNWDRGFEQVALSSQQYDIAVVITDGNPTVYGNPSQGPGNYTRFRETENGIFSANAIKAKGTRLLALGVGAGVAGAGDNLRSVSGPVTNSDYFQTADYAQVGSILRALALGNCLGSVTVVKQVVPPSTPPGQTTGAVPTGGFTFGATATNGVTVAPPSGQTAAGTGALNFALSFPGGVTTAPVTVTETQQPGYTLQQVNGSNGTCVRTDTGATVASTNVGALGFSVPAASAYAVSCTVYDRAPNPPASVVVNKTWVVNGVSFPEGSQNQSLIAALTLNATPQPWDVPRTGFVQGNTVAINETTNISGLPLCTLTSSRVTTANGATISQPLPYSPTLTGGANTYGITNTLTCNTRLRLTKQVIGGTAPPSSWTLTALAPAGGLPGPSGATGVNVLVTADVTYTLAESVGDPRYIQDVAPNAVLRAGSTGSWNCVEVTADGSTVIPGFADGLNGGVTVPLGTYVSCGATNRTAFLSLAKQVVNTRGGTATAAQWNLTATPDPLTGLTASTVPGSTAGQQVQVRPNWTYTLSEAGPAGYLASAWTCTGAGVTLTGNRVTVPRDTTASCSITNTDQPAQLTLVKVVDNGASGATTPAMAWTLTAAGPTPISGATGTPAVTNAAVNAGAYTLSETGPPGYGATAWTCTGAAVTGGNSVTLPVGGSARCTITNSAIVPTLTLVKVVDQAGTGATAVPADWTLTAVNGASTITGPGNSPAVTAQNAIVGTYTLSESGGPPGYTASAWICTGGVSATASTVTLTTGSDARCTITNTAIAPTLTLVKEVVNTSGGTALPAEWTLNATGVVTISGVTGSPAVTAAAVRVGTYTLTETGGPTGYTASTWTCTGATVVGGDTVTLAAGADASCTITNTDQPAVLTLRKIVDPAASGSGKVPADWTLTATPVAIAGQPVVTGNGDPTSPGGVNQRSVFAGQYTLSESGPPGFDSGAWLCQGAVQTGATVTVPNGGAVVCTITNTARTPRLTLVKVVDNGTSGGTAVPTDWTLTAAGPTPISGATGSPPVTAAAVTVGTYALSESGPAGYTASGWTCTGATFTSTSVTVVEGDVTTCTITNTAIPPRLTLVKTVVNTHGGSAVATDWTLTAAGPTPISGVTGSAPVTAVTVTAGSYTLSETGPAGYSASAWNCAGAIVAGATITLVPGDDVTCTVTNTDLPAELTLRKVVDNGASGATRTPADWTLTATPIAITGQPVVTGNGADGVTALPVFAGRYTLSESGPGGYLAQGWTCTGGTVADTTLTVPNGAVVTCSITNRAQPPTLTLVKQVDNGDTGATTAATAWTLTAAGPSRISGVTGTPAVTDAVALVGTYALTETGPPGYQASDWMCTGNGVTATPTTVTLGEGAAGTCAITNTARPALLTLIKRVINSHGGTAAPIDWTLSAAGPTPISGVTGVAAVTRAVVRVGSYRLAEAGPSGYTASGWVCAGAPTTGSSVQLALGDDVTCTITNTDQAQPPGPPVPPQPPQPPAPPVSPDLPDTGAAVLPLLWIAALAVALGCVVLLAGRRRG